MAKTKAYKVSMKKGFPAASHYRAGITLQRNESRVVELTDDQVKEIKDDRYMEIRVASAADAEGTTQSGDAGTGEGSASTTGDEGTGSEGSDQGSSDQGTGTQEGDGSEGSQDEGSSEGEGSEGDDAGSGESSEGTDSSEEGSQAPTVDELVRDNSREELNAMAKEAGVEDPESLDNKPAVAEAIVAKREA